jgi:cobalamin biosynthesis Mg chelatase CobN
MNDKGRRTLLATATGLLVAVLIGLGAPMTFASGEQPKQTLPWPGATTSAEPVVLGETASARERAEQRKQVLAAENSNTQAFVVGTVAFLLMIGAAGAVFWFTAKHRHED